MLCVCLLNQLGAEKLIKLIFGSVEYVFWSPLLSSLVRSGHDVWYVHEMTSLSLEPGPGGCNENFQNINHSGNDFRQTPTSNEPGRGGGNRENLSVKSNQKEIRWKIDEKWVKSGKSNSRRCWVNSSRRGSSSSGMSVAVRAARMQYHRS